MLIAEINCLRQGYAALILKRLWMSHFCQSLWVLVRIWLQSRRTLQGLIGKLSTIYFRCGQ